MVLRDTTIIEQEPESSVGGWRGFYGFVQQRDLMPPYGTYECDIALRALYRAMHNTLIQGAIAGKIMRVRATPWELKGGRNLTYRFQEFLQDAHFGEGWANFLSKVLVDYHTQNKGAFILVHGPGDPLGPITGKVKKIYHLDAGRCYLTGNFDYPVVYYSRRTGKMHRLYKDRVIHLVDTPDPDESYFNFGMCALYRMASVSTTQMLMSKYQVERLDDLPPAGILTVSGITDAHFRMAMEAYQADRTRSGGSIWSSMLRLHAVDPHNPLKVESIPFSQLPEHFDYQAYMDTHVNLVALSLGVDRQDIFPLQGRMAGTATQSAIMSERASGKGYADVLSMIERAINTQVLPEELEFTFKFQDQQSDQAQAEKAQVWVNIAAAAPGLTDEQRARLLANQVPAFADVLLDPSGELIKVPDADDKPSEVTAEDVTPLGTEDDVQVSDERKEIQATRLDFEGKFSDVLAEARAGGIGKSRFRTLTRGLIGRYGRMAFEDGLKDGGVNEPPDDDDLREIAAMLAAQSEFVAGLADVLFTGGGISDAQAEQKPAMWYNKSIDPFYQAGRMSANKNGLYEWVLGKAEHCPDCLRLSGQKRRIKGWKKQGLLPKSSKLACKGFNCKCSLAPATGRATAGRYL